jgi:twitching motility protein PilT
MQYSVDAKVFPAGEGAMLSMNDMMAYFEKQGALRVSDLHIKNGTQPCYRIDGDLVKLKGGVVTNEIAEKLIFPLLGDKNIETLKQDTAVDCSYRFGTLQFRINAF